MIDFGELSLRESEKRGGKLFEIVRNRVFPVRSKDNREHRRKFWWQHGEPQKGLYAAIRDNINVLVCPQTGPHLQFALRRNFGLYSSTVMVFTFDSPFAFATLQSRAHELWARVFSSSMKDDLRYAPSDCFRTFPFPIAFEIDPALEDAGEAYHAHRAALMVAREEGLTKTYNRFHARAETAPDIVRLRDLHADMDRAILRAYGWRDLAERAAPEFIEQDADEGKTPKTRLDWPAEFKDEVLARLLALNAERANHEYRAGLVSSGDDDADGEDDDVDD